MEALVEMQQFMNINARLDLKSVAVSYVLCKSLAMEHPYCRRWCNGSPPNLIANRFNRLAGKSRTNLPVPRNDPPAVLPVHGL